MPNGKPGDHPYTDIITHDAELYTESIRELVLAIAASGDASAQQRASELLLEFYPADLADSELSQLEAALRELRDTLD